MKNGDIVSGKVKEIAHTHIIVELQGGLMGLLHVSEISDYFVNSLDQIFNRNSNYDFLVIDIMSKGVKLSWKRIIPRYLKNPFKFELKNTKRGFQNLLKFVEEEVKND